MKLSASAPCHGGQRAQRVYQLIHSAIRDGGIPQGSRLPAERELAQQLNVSRDTVRRAIAQLRADGYVESLQGSGTYVSGSWRRAVPSCLSFSRFVRAAGLVPGGRVFLTDQRAATIDEGEVFSIAPGEPVTVLSRIRTINDLVVGVAETVVPLSCTPHLLAIDWTCGSVFDELARSGQAPVRGTISAEAQRATPELAQLLELDSAKPVLVTDTIAYSACNRVVGTTHMTLRGDRFRLTGSARSPSQPTVQLARWPTRASRARYITEKSISEWAAKL